MRAPERGRRLVLPSPAILSNTMRSGADLTGMRYGAVVTAKAASVFAGADTTPSLPNRRYRG
jgi:hypothetical protein